MSIKLRLVLLIATSLLTALIVSLVSYVGNLRMATAVGDNTVSMSALRNHMEADMMHDALRADVYSAMLVGLGKSTATKDRECAQPALPYDQNMMPGETRKQSRDCPLAADT